MKLNFTTRFITASGRQGANARILSENARRRIEAEHRRWLTRTAAWTRGYIRRSMRRGRVNQKRVLDHNTHKFRKVPGKQRKPSAKGRPPNYHTKGKQFGLKWIRFEVNAKGTQAIIGPEYRKTKGAWRSKFRIDAHLEAGGPGKILWPERPTTEGESWQLYHGRLKHGMGPTMHWMTAKYPKRPYVAPAKGPALQFLRKTYGKNGLNSRNTLRR